MNRRSFLSAIGVGGLSIGTNPLQGISMADIAEKPESGSGEIFGSGEQAVIMAQYYDGLSVGRMDAIFYPAVMALRKADEDLRESLLQEIIEKAVEGDPAATGIVLGIFRWPYPFDESWGSGRKIIRQFDRLAKAIMDPDIAKAPQGLRDVASWLGRVMVCPQYDAKSTMGNLQEKLSQIRYDQPDDPRSMYNDIRKSVPPFLSAGLASHTLAAIGRLSQFEKKRIECWPRFICLVNHLCDNMHQLGGRTWQQIRGVNLDLLKLQVSLEKSQLREYFFFRDELGWTT